MTSGSGSPTPATNYPAPLGTVDKARWIGAGWPDYPWLFATDGEYTGFAAVASGQFAAIEDHLRALRDVSEVANGTSGKVVHEVTPDGQVYFGANSDAGNTDETAKFPSAVALVWRWTGDNAFRDEMYDFSVRNLQLHLPRARRRQGRLAGGPRQRRAAGDGRGEARQHRLHDPRPARPRRPGDRQGRPGHRRTGPPRKAAGLEKRFDKAWWYGSAAQQYADSLDDPGNVKVFQRHWIGVTPAEAEISGPAGPNGPLAPHRARPGAGASSARRPCYTGHVRPVPHRHRGHQRRPATPAPTCDSPSPRSRPSGRSSR